MSFKPVLHIQHTDGRLGKVEKVLDDRKLLVWFKSEGPPEVIEADKAAEILSEHQFRKRYYAKKGIIIK